MIKKVIIAISLALLFLAGCGQPAPDLGDNGLGGPGSSVDDNNTVEPVDIGEDNPNGAGGTIVNGGAGGDGTDTITPEDITETTFTGNNSSADNFRSIYFDFDRYNIASSMESNMNHNGKVANSVSTSLKIEGNCDEFGTDEYNYALGLKRAKTVKDRLSSQGVDSRRMVMVSFGESNPVCRETTDSCYDRNRRVDIRLAR